MYAPCQIDLTLRRIGLRDLRTGGEVSDSRRVDHRRFGRDVEVADIPEQVTACRARGCGGEGECVTVRNHHRVLTRGYASAGYLDENRRARCKPVIRDRYGDCRIGACICPFAEGEPPDGDERSRLQIVRLSEPQRDVAATIPCVRLHVDGGKLLRCSDRLHVRERQPQLVEVLRVGRRPACGESVSADLGLTVPGVVEPLLIVLVLSRSGDVYQSGPCQEHRLTGVRVAQGVERADFTGAPGGCEHHRARGGDQITRVELAVPRNLSGCVREKLPGHTRHNPEKLGDLSRGHYFFFAHLPADRHLSGDGQPLQGLNTMPPFL